MDMETLGINLALIAGIIALTAVLRKLDSAKRFKRFYVLIPLFLGIIGAIFATTPITWQGVGLNAIIYAGIASYIYNAGKKLSFAGISISSDDDAPPQTAPNAGVPTPTTTPQATPPSDHAPPAGGGLA